MEAWESAKKNQKISFIGGIEGYKFDLLLDINELANSNTNSINDRFIRQFESIKDLKFFAEKFDERDLKAWIRIVENISNIPHRIDEIKKWTVKDKNLADICLSTTHKSKGLEFGSVKLASDFPAAELINEPPSNQRNSTYPASWQYGPTKYRSTWKDNKFLGHIDFSIEEINIQYVAASRAEGNLELPKGFQDPFEYVKRYPSFRLNPEIQTVVQAKATPKKQEKPKEKLKIPQIRRIKRSKESGGDYPHIWVGEMAGKHLIVVDLNDRPKNKRNIYYWPIGSSVVIEAEANSIREKVKSVVDDRRVNAIQQYLNWDANQ